MKTYNCEICNEIRKPEETYILHEGEGKIGLYCAKCNDWIRWITEDEENVMLSAGSILKEEAKEIINEKTCNCQHEIIEKLKELSAYLNNKIMIESNTKTRTPIEEIKKDTYCYACKEMKEYVDNIIQGKEFLHDK